MRLLLQLLSAHKYMTTTQCNIKTKLNNAILETHEAPAATVICTQIHDHNTVQHQNKLNSAIFRIAFSELQFQIELADGPPAEKGRVGIWQGQGCNWRERREIDGNQGNGGKLKNVMNLLRWRDGPLPSHLCGTAPTHPSGAIPPEAHTCLM